MPTVAAQTHALARPATYYCTRFGLKTRLAATCRVEKSNKLAHAALHRCVGVYMHFPGRFLVGKALLDSMWL